MAITYNYLRNMVSDILNWIDENMTIDEILEIRYDNDEAINDLYDRLWVEDAVTGNASGSYWFSRYDAEEALLHNWDLCISALNELGVPRDFNPESLDVTIRCFLLQEAIFEAIEKIPERFWL